jgi:poly(3-hydroxybutyrate) depolymerase
VTSIINMVSHLRTTRNVDPNRVFVTGLSAGGAMTSVLLSTHLDMFREGAVMAGLPFRCAQTQLEAFNCMNSPPDRTPQQHCDLVRGVAGTSGFPAPRVSTWHGTSDFTVEVGNLTELVDQWTNVNGVDVVADATATIGAATRREYRNAQGQTRVESWTISNMSHGTPVDPRRGCGTAGAFVLDVQLCSSRFAGEFFGLIPTSSQDAGVVVDAGPGPVSDAGTPPDAGSAFDAGTAADAGSRPDAGVGRVSGVHGSQLHPHRRAASDGMWRCFSELLRGRIG